MRRLVTSGYYKSIPDLHAAKFFSSGKICEWRMAFCTPHALAGGVWCGLIMADCRKGILVDEALVSIESAFQFLWKSYAIQMCKDSYAVNWHQVL